MRPARRNIEVIAMIAIIFVGKRFCLRNGFKRIAVSVSA